MHFPTTPLHLLALVTSILATPATLPATSSTLETIQESQDLYPRQARLNCWTTDRSPLIKDLITAENKLRARTDECYQHDSSDCQTHAQQGGARIQICDYPIYHAPCYTIANMAQKVLESCGKGGRAAGNWYITGKGKAVVLVGA